MKHLLSLNVIVGILGIMSTSVFAGANDWVGYGSVERYQHRVPTTTYQYTDQNGLTKTKQIPMRPPQNSGQWGHYPSYPHYPNRPYPVYPQQNGVTIIYRQQLPTTNIYHSESHGYVNGNGTIESSQYMLISDWRRYGLPDPQVGMHWVYENGRYIQIPNDR